MNDDDDHYYSVLLFSKLLKLFSAFSLAVVCYFLTTKIENLYDFPLLNLIWNMICSLE